MLLLPLRGVAASNNARPDSVMASILTASPGFLIYQCTGHSAIRLQSPYHGLDYVVSYETDSENLLSHLAGTAHGRFSAIPFENYCAGYAEEARQVTEYPLNLTDEQIRKLWRNLDDAVARKEEGAFNIRYANCNSRAMDMIIRAIEPDDRILMLEDSISKMNNATLTETKLKDESPWAWLVLTMALGSGADETDSWRTRMLPVTMDDHFKYMYLASAEGSIRPFLSREPEVIVQSRPSTTALPSPATAAIVIFSIVALVSGLDVSGRCTSLVRMSDCIFLIVQSAVGVMLIALTVSPAGIGGLWNWMLVPFNPLPFIVWLTSRRSHWCGQFFICYGAVCALFILAPLVTTQAGIYSSAAAAAISLRIFTHYLKTNKPNHK